MGTMPGYKQVTLYIDPLVYEQAAHVAKMVGEPGYTFINKAIADAIKARTTPEQRKAIEILTSSGGKKNERREDAGTDDSGGAGKKRKDSRKGRASR